MVEEETKEKRAPDSPGHESNKTERQRGNNKKVRLEDQVLAPQDEYLEELVRNPVGNTEQYCTPDDGAQTNQAPTVTVEENRLNQEESGEANHSSSDDIDRSHLFCNDVFEDPEAARSDETKVDEDDGEKIANIPTQSPQASDYGEYDSDETVSIEDYSVYSNTDDENNDNSDDENNAAVAEVNSDEDKVNSDDENNAAVADLNNAPDATPGNDEHNSDDENNSAVAEVNKTPGNETDILAVSETLAEQIKNAFKQANKDYGDDVFCQTIANGLKTEYGFLRDLALVVGNLRFSGQSDNADGNVSLRHLSVFFVEVELEGTPLLQLFRRDGQLQTFLKSKKVDTRWEGFIQILGPVAKRRGRDNWLFSFVQMKDYLFAYLSLLLWYFENIEKPPLPVSTTEQTPVYFDKNQNYQSFFQRMDTFFSIYLAEETRKTLNGLKQPYDVDVFMKERRACVLYEWYGKPMPQNREAPQLHLMMNGTLQVSFPGRLYDDTTSAASRRKGFLSQTMKLWSMCIDHVCKCDSVSSASAPASSIKVIGIKAVQSVEFLDTFLDQIGSSNLIVPVYKGRKARRVDKLSTKFDRLCFLNILSDDNRGLVGRYFDVYVDFKKGKKMVLKFIRNYKNRNPRVYYRNCNPQGEKEEIHGERLKKLKAIQRKEQLEEKKSATVYINGPAVSVESNVFEPLLETLFAYKFSESVGIDNKDFLRLYNDVSVEKKEKLNELVATRFREMFANRGTKQLEVEEVLDQIDNAFLHRVQDTIADEKTVYFFDQNPEEDPVLTEYLEEVEEKGHEYEWFLLTDSSGSSNVKIQTLLSRSITSSYTNIVLMSTVEKSVDLWYDKFSKETFSEIQKLSVWPVGSKFITPFVDVALQKVMKHNDDLAEASITVRLMKSNDKMSEFDGVLLPRPIGSGATTNETVENFVREQGLEAIEEVYKEYWEIDTLFQWLVFEHVSGEGKGLVLPSAEEMLFNIWKDNILRKESKSEDGEDEEEPKSKDDEHEEETTGGKNGEDGVHQEDEQGTTGGNNGGRKEEEEVLTEENAGNEGKGEDEGSAEKLTGDELGKREYISAVKKLIDGLEYHASADEWNLGTVVIATEFLRVRFPLFEYSHKVKMISYERDGLSSYNPPPDNEHHLYTSNTHTGKVVGLQLMPLSGEFDRVHGLETGKVVGHYEVFIGSEKIWLPYKLVTSDESPVESRPLSDWL